MGALVDWLQNVLGHHKHLSDLMITIHFGAFKCLLVGISTVLNGLNISSKICQTYMCGKLSTQTQFEVPSKNTYDTFTLDVKSMLNENLGDILGGMQC
jgi:hypothetical protein